MSKVGTTVKVGTRTLVAVGRLDRKRYSGFFRKADRFGTTDVLFVHEPGKATVFIAAMHGDAVGSMVQLTDRPILNVFCQWLFGTLIASPQFPDGSLGRAVRLPIR